MAERVSESRGRDGNPGVVSESTLRASAGPAWERPALSLALERLVGMLGDEGLTEEEEFLLGAVSRNVSQSRIAEWLGITHGAARNRVMRLRARLKEACMRHAAQFVGAQRAELDAFFRRTNASGGRRAASGDPGGPPVSRLNR